MTTAYNRVRGVSKSKYKANVPMRLLFTGKDMQGTEEPRFNFVLDNRDISLEREDAIALVSSIPSEMRNCHVAFNSIVLKPNYATH